MIKLVSIKGSTKYNSCPTCGELHARYNTTTNKMNCAMCNIRFMVASKRKNDPILQSVDKGI